MSHAAKLAEATVATTKTKAEALATVGIITPDVEIREAADATDDDDEIANQDRGDDLDRTEADGGQPTLAPGTPDGPVGHDHGGAPSEPESATQSDPASAPPGRAPTTEDLDPLVVTDDMLRRASALVRPPGTTPLATVELAVWVLYGRGGVVTATSTLVVTDDMLRRASALVSWAILRRASTSSRPPGTTPLATVELAVWVLYGHEVAPLREQAST